MINVLKNTLAYTLIYFLITTVMFWCIFFVHVAILVFWKPMVVVALILFAVFTFDHYKKRTTLPSIEDLIAEARA